MRIHILYNFKDGPWGGGNQFLKALKGALIDMGVYEELLERADVVLFNSHHFGQDCQALEDLMRLRQYKPKARIIHRVDGPIQTYRGGDAAVDELIFKANDLLADATIFQTGWSKENTDRLGLKVSKQWASLLNAPDGSVFYPPKKPRARSGKIKLVATSFSSNMRKGFDVYAHLDQHLDFSKYEMSFIGNSPIEFENIRHIPPMESKDLADELRQHDVFITASQHDPCSNSLIEALHCGLPALVRNSGGHPEIVGAGGVVFDGTGDVLDALGRLMDGYDVHKEAINVPSIAEVAQRYVDFINGVTPVEKACTSKDVARIKAALKRHAFVSRITGGLKRRLGMAS